MLILASNSPRRKEILTMLGYSYSVKPSDCDESTDEKNPEKLVKLLSKRKAKCIKRNPGDTVLGSDTVVYFNGKILGKPKDKNDAFDMLSALSGNTHTVYTGITVISDNGYQTTCVSSNVTFIKITDSNINSYIASGEPMDKAGSYAVQGIGAAFVEKIEGDFFAVMGLSACRSDIMLKKAGCKPDLIL